MQTFEDLESFFLTSSYLTFLPRWWPSRSCMFYQQVGAPNFFKTLTPTWFLPLALPSRCVEVVLFPWGMWKNCGKCVSAELSKNIGCELHKKWLHKIWREQNLSLLATTFTNFQHHCALLLPIVPVNFGWLKHTVHGSDWHCILTASKESFTESARGNLVLPGDQNGRYKLTIAHDNDSFTKLRKAFLRF